MGFNSKTAQFAWKNFKLLVDGRYMTELTDIEIKESREIEEIYAAGDEAQYLGEGNKAVSGHIEMLQSGYEALVTEGKSRGGTGALDVECTFVLSYIPKSNEPIAMRIAKTIVDRVVGVKFTEEGKSFSQGATHMKVRLPFKALVYEKQI
ncbi:MAG: hypothetical protein JEZ14_15100 [Marinilabiliaceae bacterium]|nr:hypothetical protein [Marinilabiliaceae bacterium]